MLKVINNKLMQNAGEMGIIQLRLSFVYESLRHIDSRARMCNISFYIK